MDKVKPKYFTIRELMEEAQKLAEKDPGYQQAKDACFLDYALISTGRDKDSLTDCSFDVVSCVTYGGSEGIYASVALQGKWMDRKIQDILSPGGRCHAMTLKTLKTDKEAYVALGTMANLICFYANQIVRENLDRFD